MTETTASTIVTSSENDMSLPETIGDSLELPRQAISNVSNEAVNTKITIVIDRKTLSYFPAIPGARYDSINYLVDPDLSEFGDSVPRLFKLDGDMVVQLDSSEIASIELTKAKAIKASEISDAYQSVLTEGYDTGDGYWLSASAEDQVRFTQDAILHDKAVSIGVKLLSDITVIVDRDGYPRMPTIERYIEILVGYGLWVRDKFTKNSVLQSQLLMASTVSEIESIQINF